MPDHDIDPDLLVCRRCRFSKRVLLDHPGTPCPPGRALKDLDLEVRCDMDTRILMVDYHRPPFWSALLESLRREEPRAD